MPPAIETYKWQKRLDTTPVQPGGVALNDNFTAIADSLGPANKTAIIAPTADDDSGEGYYYGSTWWDSVAGILYQCVDESEGSAVWKKIYTASPTFDEITVLGAGSFAEGVSIPADSEKLTFGAEGATDSYIQFGGTNLEISTTGNITCFEGTTGNPEFRVYGYDTGASAVKYGFLKIRTDGTFQVGAQDSEGLYLTSAGTAGKGITIDKAGDVYLQNDAQKFALGAGGDIDSYLQFDGSDLAVYSSGDLLVTAGTNKTLELTNPVYDDVSIDTSNVKIPAANAPAWTAYKGGQVLAFEPSSDEIIYFTAQLPHGYKQGEDIEFHLHVVCPDANAGNVRWNFTYSFASINGTFPSETTVAVDLASSGVADKHIIHEVVGTISGIGINISAGLICSLEREGSHANDTYASNIYLIFADFHVPINTLGSRQATSK